MVWTRFMDMHSGGSQKEKWPFIYIEAPEEEAVKIFYNRFGHNPDRVTCTCCGADYSFYDAQPSLEEASSFDRNDYESEWNARPKVTLEDWLKKEGEEFLLIREADIKPEERGGEVPRQGFIWVG